MRIKKQTDILGEIIEEEVSCMSCGRIYKTQVGFQKHKCKPMPEVVSKRKLTEKEQLYHDIISDGNYYLLDNMNKEELEDFLVTILEQEPSVKLFYPNNMNIKRKNVSKLYLNAYIEAMSRLNEGTDKEA